MTLVRRIIYASCALLLIACGESYSTYNSYRTAYLPYIDGVTLPEQINEGEAFEIALALTAALEPGILNRAAAEDGPARFPQYSALKWLNPVSVSSSQQQGEVLISPWIEDGFYHGEALSEVVFQIQPLAEGVYRLDIESADSPTWGGLSGKYIIAPTFNPPQHEHATVQEYTFEVLPAEDGEGYRASDSNRLQRDRKVWDRIVATRSLSTECTDPPVAGVLDFDAALQGW